MNSSLTPEEKWITAGMRRAVESATPSPAVWDAISDKTSSRTRTETVRSMFIAQRAMPYAFVLIAVAITSTVFGVRMLLDDNGDEVARAATIDNENYELAEVGESLVTVKADSDDVVFEVRITNPPETGPESPRAETEADRLLNTALQNLTETEFSVSTLQTSVRHERTMVFESIIDRYFEGPDLYVDRVAEEAFCESTPVDVPGAGMKTICKMIAKEDGAIVGESYTMPVYRVTEASYVPGGEILVRSDDRTATPIPSVNRSTVYHGDVRLWRLVDGEVEYRNAISVGNFDLVGGPDWKSLGYSVEPGIETIEWMLSTQVPEWRWLEDTRYSDSEFVPGADFRASSFESVEVVVSEDESVLVLEGRRPIGFQDHTETVRFVLDAVTRLPLSITVGIREFLPYMIVTDFRSPLEFVFEYPEG